ncbi:hypothetical protein Tco_0857621 [Tanacetum coccineum]|uniref:Uncharacterized protein n=1 Tax=Tanacetum coccineum TaxID=301880 RepID=A0ABQ5B8M9_9ASTR
MAWFEQLETHLRDLYLNSPSHVVDAFKPTFHSFFGEEHQTFRVKMFHNLDQLRLQLCGSVSLLEVNPRTCLEALRTQFKEFFASKRITATVNKDVRINRYNSGRLINLGVKALDDGSVITESSGTKSDKHDTSSSSGTFITHVVDADIRPVNDQVPFVEVQLTAQHNVLTNEHSILSYLTNYELYVGKENEKLNKENDHLKQTYKELYDSIKRTRIQTKDHNDSLIDQVNSKTVENADLKAQIQEKVFANVALKNELRKLKGNNMDTKFAKPSILGKPVLQPPRNQSVVRQPNAFKSERPNFSKPRFASQVDVNNVLSKPVTLIICLSSVNNVLAKTSSRDCTWLI